MFSTLSKTEIIIFVTFNLLSSNAFNLISKFCCLVIGEAEMLVNACENVENIMGKEENAGC